MKKYTRTLQYTNILIVAAMLLLGPNVLFGQQQGCVNFFGSDGLPDGGTSFYQCNPGDTVIVDATNSQGGNPNYSWSTGASTPIIQVTAMGTYYVTITQGATSCILEYLVTDTNLVPNLGPDTIFCPGDTFALGTVSNFASYQWSTGETSDTISVTSAGQYSVTVQDSFLNCSGVDTVNLTLYSLPPNSISGIPQFCPSTSTTLNGPAGFNDYLWSTGATTDSIVVSTPGNYSITVTDSNNCSASDSVAASYYPVVNVDIGGDKDLCIGDTLTIGSLQPYAQYLWSTGATTQSISVTTGGTYSLTVTDVNGCTSSDTMEAVLRQLPTVNLGNDTSLCPSASLTLIAGGNHPFYQWNDGSSADTLDVTAAGTYYVLIQDTNDCLNSDTIVVGQYSLPVVGLGNDTAICDGDQITLTSQTGHTSYSWNNGETTSSITIDSASTYVLVVVDSNSCTNFDEQTVSINPLPVVTFSDDSICNGSSLTLDAGSGYASYAWSNGGNTQTQTLTTPGTYTVTVTDTASCVDTASMNLSFMSDPVVDLGGDQTTCIGDSVTLSPTLLMTAYNWSTGDTTPSITVGSQGTYWLEGTGANGCTATDSMLLVVTNLPTPSLGPDLSYCIGSTLNAVVSTSQTYAAYEWQNGSTNGFYQASHFDDTIWVEVEDVFGCKGSDTLLVIEDPLPIINVGNDTTICQYESITFNPSNGGGAFQSFIWSNGSTNQTVTIYGFDNTSSGPYSVTITDTNGCVNSDTVLLTVSDLPSPNLGQDTSYCIGDAFQHTLFPGAFDSYLWNDGSTTASKTIFATAGTYSVTVTDAAGCQNSDQYVVTENLLPTPNLGADTAYCEGITPTIVLNPGAYEDYLWSSGETNTAIVVNTQGTYSVTVTDINGCIGDDQINIVENPAPIVGLGSDQDFCEGVSFNDTLDASSGVVGAGYSYEWNTGWTNPVLVVNVPATYIVTVTNNNTGCESTDNITYSYFPLAEPNLGDDGFICNGEALTLDPGVNIDGYTYEWNTGATTQTINVFQPGLYWVELNASNGTCLEIRDTIRLDPGTVPVVELGPNQNVCLGQTVILLNDQTPFPNATYTWQDDSNEPIYYATETGLYEIAVSNRCGTAIDQVYLRFDDCSNVWIPNSFTPNEDGKNDIFLPKSDQEMREYLLRIYDRWGNLVFITNVPHQGWDGKVNGEYAPTETYTYKISWVSAYDNFTRREEIGAVTLIR